MYPLLNQIASSDAEKNLQKTGAEVFTPLGATAAGDRIS